MRFQVRKRDGLWEVWLFRGKSWELYDQLTSFVFAMVLATGQHPWGDDSFPWTRRLELLWSPR